MVETAAPAVNRTGTVESTGLKESALVPTTPHWMSESSAPPGEHRPETGLLRASHPPQVTNEVVCSEFGGAWGSDPTRPAYATPEPATQVASIADAPAVREVESGMLPVALLAGAGAALVGGLVWSGVVIATGFDFGILAWVVGAAIGLVVVRVAGGPIGTVGRIAAGLLAVAGVTVGKYVIFVHEVRDLLGARLAAQGLSAGYLDTRQMSIFVHHFGSIVHVFYALWLALAFLAAVRTAGGDPVFRRRR
jgi:hypothetical protein